MPIRGGMAGLAVDRTDVLEQDIVPFGRAVAVRTLTIVVPGRGGVAGSAICVPGMVECDVGPAAGCMAVRA